MRNLKKELSLGRTLISDGAWGTFLQQKGLAPGECPELWNLTRPNDVFDIAHSYVLAGADMVETNSFGANSYKLAPFGLQSKVYEINKAAAEISRKAAGNSKYVLGSIGPTGKMIITGDVTYDDLYAVFAEQAAALYEGGADAIVIETMSDIEETRAAVHACKDKTKAVIIVTMTFEKTAEDTYHTMMGVTPAEMTAEMVKAEADVIGANCGNGIINMIGIVKEIRKVNSVIPVLIHANAGVPEYRNGVTVFPESPDQMASSVKELIKAGANIIGGCCGTTPDHIRKIADAASK